MDMTNYQVSFQITDNQPGRARAAARAYIVGALAQIEEDLRTMDFRVPEMNLNATVAEVIG